MGAGEGRDDQSIRLIRSQLQKLRLTLDGSREITLLVTWIFATQS